MNTAPSEQLAVSAGSTLYGFAEQCVEWAKNARSIQERAVYMRMAMQWLDAGARLQTFQLTKCCKNQTGEPP
jgi:hypothetical protein